MASVGAGEWRVCHSDGGGGDSQPCCPSVYCSEGTPFGQNRTQAWDFPRPRRSPWQVSRMERQLREGSGMEREQAAAWRARDPGRARGLPDLALPSTQGIFLLMAPEMLRVRA